MNFETELIKLLPKRFQNVDAWQVLMEVFGSMMDEIHADIEGIADLTDKDNCPEEYLPYLAENQGFSLKVSAGTESEFRKRLLLKALPYVYKSRGRIGLIEEVIKFFYFYGTSLTSAPAYQLWSKDYERFTPHDGRVTETPTGWTGDGVTKTFTGTLTDAPARERSVNITVLGVGDVALSAWDDSHNELQGDITAGTLNHTTGVISVTFSTAPKNGEDIDVTYIVEEGQYLTPHFAVFFPTWVYRELGLDDITVTPWTGDGGTQDFSTTLRKPVKAGSVVVTATDIYGNAMTLTDNGLGFLAGDAGSGDNEINYTTGVLDVSFDFPVVADGVVTVVYVLNNVYTGRRVFAEMVSYLDRYRPVHTVLHTEVGESSEFWRVGVTKYRVGGAGLPAIPDSEVIRIGGKIWL